MSAPGVRPRDDRRAALAALAGAALAAGVLLTLLALRPPAERLWGDEGTYVAMAASLVRDGDLAFTEADLEWTRQRRPEGATVILQRTGSGLRYSKPTLYPLLGAPFYALAGEAGLVLANALALGLALWLAWVFWRERAGDGGAALIVAGFAGAGALLPYVVWRMSDVLQVSLTLAGLVLGVGALRAAKRGHWLAGRWAPWAGGLLLGFAVSMRVPNLAAPAAAVVAATLAGRRRRAAALLLGTALGLGLAWGASELLITTWNPYRAVRTSFDGSTGYPVGPGGEVAARRFDLDPATNRLGLFPRDEPERIAYSALYFFVGRHSGIAVYFPAALVLAAAAFRRRDAIAWSLAGGAAAICLFYVLWIPQNYFGGSTFVGDRYFLTAYALLLVAPARPPGRRWWIPVWAVALVAGASAVQSVAAARALDPMSQTHAYAGLFRHLPYETTGRRIDGQRDRYWAGDFVRLVDPWAEAGAEVVTLTLGRPPAEVLIATSWPGDVLTLEVTPDRPGLELAVSDWAGSWSYPLPAGDAPARVELTPSAAWRRHRFWWSEDLYWVRTVRLALHGEDGRPAQAGIRYLGRRAGDAHR